MNNEKERGNAERCDECGKGTRGLSGEPKWCCYCGARLTGTLWPEPAVTFEAAWAQKEREGYQYGADATYRRALPAERDLLREALSTIEQWQVPAVESRGETVSMEVAYGSKGVSMEVAYGSKGVSDYFRDIARAALQSQDPEDAEVTAYALPGGISVERRMQRDGTYLWAVLDSLKRCLNRDGEWNYEPLPSSRTDDWIAQHRFSSAAFSIDHARRIEGEGNG